MGEARIGLIVEVDTIGKVNESRVRTLLGDEGGRPTAGRIAVHHHDEALRSPEEVTLGG